MQLQFPYLVSAIGIDEIITVLFVLGSLGIWVMSQIADAKKKQAQKAQRQAGPPPNAADKPVMAQGQPGQGDRLRAQVDEFLRRAGQQGQPQGAQPGPRQPAARREEIELLVDDEVKLEPARQPLAKPLRSKEQPPGRQVPIEAKQKRPPRPPRLRGAKQGETIAQHVASHVDAAVDEIRQEVSHLGESVIAADEQFDVQLNQRFEHRLGSLRDHHLTPVQEQIVAVQADTPAAKIAAMLSNPEGVRQAIIVNEILRRPVDQW